MQEREKYAAFLQVMRRKATVFAAVPWDNAGSDRIGQISDREVWYETVLYHFRGAADGGAGGVQGAGAGDAGDAGRAVLRHSSVLRVCGGEQLPAFAGGGGQAPHGGMAAALPHGPRGAGLPRSVGHRRGRRGGVRNGALPVRLRHHGLQRQGHLRRKRPAAGGGSVSVYLRPGRRGMGGLHCGGGAADVSGPSLRRPCTFGQGPPLAALLFAPQKAAAPKESHPKGGSLLWLPTGFVVRTPVYRKEGGV